MKSSMTWMIALGLMAGAASADGLKGDGKYGTAGCGLGSLLFANQKGGIQILAATFNATFGNQTFGITSGTLNCAEDGVAMVDKEKEFFANANFESLMQEMAQGKGENLYAMASLFGCGSSAFATSMQSNYGKIFPTGETDSQAMLANMEAVVGADAGLQHSCKDVN